MSERKDSKYCVLLKCVDCGQERLGRIIKGEIESPRCNRCAAKLRTGGKFTKGEDVIYSQGYLWVWNPSHPKAHDGRIKRSRQVLESKLGRLLYEGCIPHHINGNKLDDTPDNLEEKDKREHISQHRPVGFRRDR